MTRTCQGQRRAGTDISASWSSARFAVQEGRDTGMQMSRPSPAKPSLTSGYDPTAEFRTCHLVSAPFAELGRAVSGGSGTVPPPRRRRGPSHRLSTDAAGGSAGKRGLSGAISGAGTKAPPRMPQADSPAREGRRLGGRPRGLLSPAASVRSVDGFPPSGTGWRNKGPGSVRRSAALSRLGTRHRLSGSDRSEVFLSGADVFHTPAKAAATESYTVSALLNGTSGKQSGTFRRTPHSV